MDELRVPARMDAVAFALSLLCLVHCLGLPFLAAASPLIGLVAKAEWVHWLLVAFAAPVSLFALSRKSTPSLARATAAAGIGLLVMGAAMFPDDGWETVLSVSGSIALVCAHFVNARRVLQTRQRKHL
jgi:MerC mercury resistance protein